MTGGIVTTLVLVGFVVTLWVAETLQARWIYFAAGVLFGLWVWALWTLANEKVGKGKGG